MPVGGGRAWPGFETTRRAKLAARTASGRAAARRHARQPGSTVRRDGARNASGAASNTVGGSPPAGTPGSPARQAARHAKQPGPTARCDGARNASGAASNVAGGPLPTDTPDSPASQQGTTVPRTGAVPGVPAERRSNGNQSACPASSVARCTPLRPASCAAWVRHENPSARYTASGCADRDGSSE